MKRLFTTLVTFIVLCLAVCSFQSCEKETKYTVWTETDTYADFQTAFQTTLDDGCYKKLEITNKEWEQIAPNLTSEGKHYWSEAEIKKWLVGNGFSSYASTKESSWLVMTDHGFLASREGNLVHLILK